MLHAGAVMVVVRRPARLLLLVCFLQRICSCGGFTSSLASYKRAAESSTSTSTASRGSSGSNEGAHRARQARGVVQPRWIGHQRNSSAFSQKRPSWIFARGGGTGRPPPLASVTNSDAEAASPTPPASSASPATDEVLSETEKPGAKKESSHLKLRSVGQNGIAAAVAAAAATAPWKWTVVDERRVATEEEEDQEQEGKEGSVSGSGERSATEIVIPAEVKGKTTPTTCSSSGGGGVDDNAGVERGNDGDRDGRHDVSAIEAEEHGGREGGDQLPPGTAQLLEYRAPPAAGGEKGETLYASLGDDVSKFIIFLESAVARGQSPSESSVVDEDGVRLDLAGGAAAAAGGLERQIFVSTVEVGDEGVERMLQALWSGGRLLSQERDAMDVLRGQEKCFSELLSSYTDRTKSNHWEVIPPQRLLDTLDEGCGADSRSLFGYTSARPPDETLSSIKTVLEWFRQDFPYYYDGCLSCGNRDNNIFVGYVYPTEEEREFRAGRTEVYRCSSCGHVSRFARYVAVSKVLETRKGRCGEYSVLMMRMLEALGYSCRWVVDWSDHVWVEARVGGRWVHIDPCEAAVDEPLLYESWGKKQTYILAFTPTAVVDVTEYYTSDFEAAKARRDVDPDTMATLLADATKTLQDP